MCLYNPLWLHINIISFQNKCLAFGSLLLQICMWYGRIIVCRRNLKYFMSPFGSKRSIHLQKNLVVWKWQNNPVLMSSDFYLFPLPFTTDCQQVIDINGTGRRQPTGPHRFQNSDKLSLSTDVGPFIGYGIEILFSQILWATFIKVLFTSPHLEIQPNPSLRS